MKFQFLWIAPLIISFGLASSAEEISEMERLQGFAEHNRKKEEFDREREKGSGEIKKKRQEWDEKIQKSVAEYKEWKSRQKATLDESSPEYKADLELKKQRQLADERSRLEFIRQRDAARRLKKTKVLLTEEKELGLVPEPERVDGSKRTLYGGKPGPSSGSGLSSGRGSADFGSPPPMDNFVPPPPPPPPPMPEFFESEVPVPPPPLDIDEPIPPPVFDEPEF